MTILAWVGFLVFSVIAIIVGLRTGYHSGWGNPKPTRTKKTVVGGLIGLVVSLVVFFALYWYYNYTESGARALKTQKSNFSGGIERHVGIYDVNGKVIKEYDGKFDIEYDDDRILFDDENGLRHIIYYPTGTVIVDEIGENNDY